MGLGRFFELHVTTFNSFATFVRVSFRPVAAADAAAKLKNTKSISVRLSLIGPFQRKKKNKSVPVPDWFPAWWRHLVALIVSQLVANDNDLVFEVVGRQRAALPRTEQGLDKKGNY